MTHHKTKLVFIDGEAGTTGLQIRDRLKHVSEVSLLSLDSYQRKDTEARTNLMLEADLTVLCLPDDAAKEAVQRAEKLKNKNVRILDASTAHRVAPGWVYGFPEMQPSQSEAIQKSVRVTNPGCYPTGVIALLRPLIERGLLPRDTPLTINAVSGYSGGGRSMIETYEPVQKAPNFELYALTLNHKHVAEMMTYTGLSRRPLFVPSVGNFRQGMLISIPLHMDTLPTQAKFSDILHALQSHYNDYPHIRIFPQNQEEILRLEPERLNQTDDLELFVCGSKLYPHALLLARLDNLGKGAAGSAIQNIKLMLGLL